MSETNPTTVGSERAIVAGLSLAIHEHRLAPGTKLSEDEVGDIYGVSRTVVRAALRDLAHARLVTIRPNRGAIVAQPSVREAREVFEARALLEPRTARSASERVTPEGIARLKAGIAAEHAALAAGEPGRALHHSGQFHIDIARMADQETILSFISALVARSSLIIALYWQRRTALCESHAHHALLAAIEAGDGARAEELMKGHLLDLVTSLDLRNQVPRATSLAEALQK